MLQKNFECQCRTYSSKRQLLVLSMIIMKMKLTSGVLPIALTIKLANDALDWISVSSSDVRNFKASSLSSFDP